jgi:hypothetical protein
MLTPVKEGTSSALIRLIAEVRIAVQNSHLRLQNSHLRLQNSDLRLQNSDLRLQDSDLRLQNSDLRLQNTEVRVPESESAALSPVELKDIVDSCRLLVANGCPVSYRSEPSGNTVLHEALGLENGPPLSVWIINALTEIRAKSGSYPLFRRIFFCLHLTSCFILRVVD